MLQAAYNTLPLDSKVLYLLNTVQTQNGPKPDDERQMAAVLLRRVFSSEFADFFGKVNTLKYF